MSDKVQQKNVTSKLSMALVFGQLIVAGAFIAATFTQHSEGLFALSPAVSSGVAVPSLDVITQPKIFAFHATIYTIWATMLLCLPAFCTVWFIKNSRVAESYWIAFWTVGLFAMLVHLYMAMDVLFERNWQHILKDTVRVTIPIPDLVLTVWWIIDVILGWRYRYSKNTILHVQRIALHVLLLVIFLIGFIREGEVLLSKFIGIGVALTVIVAVVIGIFRRQAKNA